MKIEDRGMNSQERFDDLNAGDFFQFGSCHYIKSACCKAYNLSELMEEDFFENPLVKKLKGTLVIED